MVGDGGGTSGRDDNRMQKFHNLPYADRRASKFQTFQANVAVQISMSEKGKKRKEKRDESRYREVRDKSRAYGVRVEIQVNCKPHN